MSKTKVYRTWQDMKRRCLSPDNPRFQHYGGRGIKISERWFNFENFYADMGDPPFQKAHLDRIENDGNYEKENCRWTSHQINTQNTKKTLHVFYKGKRMCLAEACRRSNFAFNTIHNRISRYKITAQQALDYAITKRNTLSKKVKKLLNIDSPGES